ncbi:hypothetical protein SAMN04488542_101314 [Fontibacillus panacisegetis]|uniref:Uncharacterized protein n=1 Tax=Fontibacillus panacisegetis TaxID=670482 RepID=A0A1G7ERW6_9BACL|nr:hypothetical protein [Fontibacillus panacisegetis]SDE66401.1 hypothetical protein SAMN04488542_101314 [Fontibacillus panacisegetis]
MRNAFNKTTVILGKKQYHLITPKLDLSELYVVKLREQNHVIFGNEDCLLNLAKVFEFSIRNPSYIFYINSKVNKLTEYLSKCWSCDSKSYDLVILQHSIQLKIHEWKQIRELWRKSIKEPISPILEVDNKITRNNREYFYSENVDFLDINDRFETLFLTGSNRVFKDISKDTLLIHDNGREQYLRFPGAHDHEHIDYYARRQYTQNYKYDGNFLCLDFYDRYLWKR